MDLHDLVVSILTGTGGKTTAAGSVLVLLIGWVGKNITSNISSRLNRLEEKVFPRDPDMEPLTRKDHDEMCDLAQQQTAKQIAALTEDMAEIKQHSKETADKQEKAWLRVYGKMDDLQTGLAGVSEVQKILVKKLVKED